MRDRIWIVGGLAVFVALISAPFWCTTHGAEDLIKLPNLTFPVNQKQCVAPANYMRAAHMQLLLRWRQDVVRHGDRRFVAFNDKVYQRSLTGTCLGCHNKEQFCDRCHAYSGVSGPYCWNCHNPSPTKAVAATPETMHSEDDALNLAQGLPAQLLSQIRHEQPSSFPRSRP
jgi:[DsrC]-trisulfide reductase subunit J